MDTPKALLRAATYLKWFRDRAITPDVEPPDDIGEIIVMLEQLATLLNHASTRPQTST